MKILKNYRIPLIKDTISINDLKKLSEWFLTNPRLTKGELTERFEEEWSGWNRNKFSIFVNSGSSANLLMLYSLLLSGRLKNKKAIVPALSWVTTVSPFIQLGMEPVLCDCDNKNLGVDLNHFEELSKKYNPGVAIIVHVLGQPNNLSTILDICRKHNIILLEDCCESHGSQYKGKKVGTFGEMASFSFYFGHHMSTVEGGMVVTDDEDLYNLMLSIRSHGWSRDLENNYAQALKEKYRIDDFRERYTFYYPGFNLRSTDLNAFLGLEQLKKLDNTVQKRFNNYLRYKKNLRPYYWIQESEGNPISSFAFGLVVDDLEKTVSALEDKSIETRPLICGSIGEQPFWIEKYGKQILPNASRVHSNGLYIPCHQELKENEIDEISEILINLKNKR